MSRIIVHCSATLNKPSITMSTIDRWHRKRGFWMVGYHFVLLTNGSLEFGRPLEMAGAHVKGYNTYSIGICLIGGVDKNNAPQENFTDGQFYSLESLLKLLLLIYPDALIQGHRDLNEHKACPCFNIQEWLERKGFDERNYSQDR